MTMPPNADSVRYHTAWLLWCFNQGYVKAEDRSILTNWLLEPAGQLSRDDLTLRANLLAMTDELLAAIAQIDGTGA